MGLFWTLFFGPAMTRAAYGESWSANPLRGRMEKCVSLPLGLGKQFAELDKTRMVWKDKGAWDEAESKGS